MNCQKFENVASELARGQIIDVELRNDALAHSEGCADCAAQLHDEEMLTRGLRSLAVEMNSCEAPAALQTNLLNAFRQQQVVVPMPVRKNYRRYWLAAVAALILVVFSVMAIRLQREVKQVSPPQVALGPQKPGKASEGVSQSPDTGSQISQKELAVSKPQVEKPRRQSSMNPNLAQARLATSRNNKNVASNHASSEVATDFMPIGYLNMESVQDGAQIVRVEVPRTALVKFGLPVNMDRPNERVKADVLLGVDGMAHAIRFVQDRKLQ
ncbi:MAG TPA: hypothetical protein VI306_18180 [Pyrinomonadaceae bacterium]